MPAIVPNVLRRFALGALLAAPGFAPAAPRAAPDFAALVAAHVDEVVNVSTLQPRRDGGPDWGEGAPESGDGTSLGSGFVISRDGFILTCAHVVDGAREIVVRLADRREYRARLVGADRRSDVALLKIDANDLRPVTIGDPARLRVGDWVLAIGAPFGFESSATSGIVSAKGRSLPNENYVSFLQTDVAINPGNSGGPLYNLKGEVVGVNSQIYSRTGAFAGVAFAIPIDIAMRIAQQLKAGSGVHRGWLGVSLQEVTHGLARAYGLDRPRGALIADVLPGGPAARSELRPGDIVLEYEGRPIALSSELPPLVGLTPPGTRARFKVFRRDGGTIDVVVPIGELSEEPATRVAAPSARPDGGRLGLVLSELTAAQRRQYQVSQGVHVDEVLDGPGREAGLQPGDVIAEVDGRPVAGIGNFYRLMTQTPADRPALLRVRRGPSFLFLALSLR
ncbi:MAG TPA: trypsin-like peptidase domain-containing protein [Burkholderiales bacterium]